MEHLKFGLVGTVGMVVATTGLENVTKVCIALATLAYTVLQVFKAWLEIQEKRKKKNDKKTD
jgi:hypothetical protein